MEEAECDVHAPVITVLVSLKKAIKILQTNPLFIRYDPQIIIEAISGIESEAGEDLSSEPNLLKLCQLLEELKTQLEKLKRFQDYSLKSLVYHQFTKYEIYQLSFAVEAEIQAFIDRDFVQNIVRTLLEEDPEEEEVLGALKELEERVSQGFDREFQELILRGKVFSILEWLICESTFSKRAKGQAALVVVALVRFNRDVFVGLVLMGPIVQALISIASSISIRVLCSLIQLIRIPMVDKIELDGEITTIMGLLSSRDLSVTIAAVDCVYEIAYFGRKEVIDVMLEQGLIEKLLELQRSVHGDNLKETCRADGGNIGGIHEECSKSDMKLLETEGEKNEGNWPFASCVARFAVQVEVGEGLEKKEKKEFKREVLRRVREASISEAEAATIIAEVLWGSSP
ncbi:hypothetical protein Tsubulata_016243 [Turnera subulata]|uniref:Uncharacterized protein n=1 Tax=Turnera subulata TaxID=218843 RepID=A0A9Q0JR28_9ROSI|nr:hypothetical protein Tsubulata_016243 [Turnera subulata]